LYNIQDETKSTSSFEEEEKLIRKDLYVEVVYPCTWDDHSLSS